MADVTPRLVPGSASNEERQCMRCQAQNPATAGFCWQCYAPFGPAAAAPSGPAGGWVRPGPRPEITPFPQSAGISAPEAAGPDARRKIGASLLSAVVAAAVAWLVVGKLFGTHITLPESVAGFTKVTSPQIEQGIDQFHQLLERLDVEGDLAFYGTGGVPRLSLIWFQNPGAPDAESAFRAFASGFNTSGATLETDALQTRAVDDVDYLCAPVSGSFRAAMCMWANGDVYWFILDTQPGLSFSKTRDLAVQAKHAIEA